MEWWQLRCHIIGHARSLAAALAGHRGRDMDIGAELTLQIARLVQERPNPPRSPARWSLVPAGSHLTWGDARAALAALPKPVFVAPMNEPGWLGIWTPATFDAKTRSRFDNELANQIAYYREKLTAFGLTDHDPIRFEPATPPLNMTAGQFVQWAGDYAIGAGVSLHAVVNERAARIVIMPPGGGGPPLGMQPNPYAPAS